MRRTVVSATIVAAALIAMVATAQAGGKKGGATKAAPLWDGKEPVAAYAKRVKLSPTESLDLGDGVKLDFVLVPAGTFVMGSPDTEEKTDEHKGHEPQHKVTVTRPFYMTKYEVTQAQYEKIAGTNPSKTKGPKLPVTDISWEDAIAAAKKASEKLHRDIKVPTDAQWEYAARAGTSTT